VVCVDRDGDGAERVARELEGDGHLAVAADVSRGSDVAAYLDAAVSRCGRIDLHHLNAGVPGPLDPLPQLDLAGFERVMGINVTGAFLGL
jgi:NAD(P)-dependent dehydrogenase (short-subunit alcohol dehydrogenase family)